MSYKCDLDTIVYFMYDSPRIHGLVSSLSWDLDKIEGSMDIEFNTSKITIRVYEDENLYLEDYLELKVEDYGYGSLKEEVFEFVGKWIEL